jgi:dienelactone hydrolase
MVFPAFMRVWFLLCCLAGSAVWAQVTKTTVTLTMPDCPNDNSYQVDVYRPAGTAPFPVVAIGHGFQNSKDNYAEVANELAAQGILVVVPQFPTFLRCGATDHARNGRILLAAIDQQVSAGVADVTRQGLGGHSAGGLAAFSASASRTVQGTLLFDAVDQSNIGSAAASSVQGPTLWLFAEPGVCNSQGNATAWFAPKPGLKGRLKVAMAGHCEPQDPVSALCNGACGGGYNAARSALFRTYAVAFFKRFLLAQPTPCLETLAQADASAGRVTEVDLRFGACGADGGTGGGAGGGTGGGSSGGDSGGGDGGGGGDASDGGVEPVTPPGGCGCTTAGSIHFGAVLLAFASRQRRRSRGSESTR